MESRQNELRDVLSEPYEGLHKGPNQGRMNCEVPGQIKSVNGFLKNQGRMNCELVISSTSPLPPMIRIKAEWIARWKRQLVPSILLSESRQNELRVRCYTVPWGEPLLRIKAEWIASIAQLFKISVHKYLESRQNELRVIRSGDPDALAVPVRIKAEWIASDVVEVAMKIEMQESRQNELRVSQILE